MRDLEQALFLVQNGGKCKHTVGTSLTLARALVTADQRDALRLTVVLCETSFKR